jgi:hypothetical protein
LTFAGVVHKIPNKGKQRYGVMPYLKLKVQASGNGDACVIFSGKDDP